MGNITLRLKPADSTLKLKVGLATSTPELTAAISAAQAAQAAAELAETHAETAETNAETAETNAASSASAASTSASSAASSASSASTSASTATTQASNASASASAASTSASNAASSASSASSSASSASASAAAAAMSADGFDDVYLGSKTSDPTLDNDGNTLIEGQLYWNVISNQLKIYDGAAWVGYSAASGLTAVVDDTAPSLGGNLDANGHTIAGRNVATDGTKLDGIEALADVTDAGNVGSSIHGATAKTTPVDADETALIDSAASNVLKKVTWANIKATLKTYFDTVYQPLASSLTSWAAITRASGFDTFTATPSSANLISLVTDETGSGALVFGTGPTLSSPIVGTQSARDGSTKGASTAYADAADMALSQNAQSADYGIVAADAGKNIHHPIADTNNRTWTLPANGTIPIPIGSVITFTNRVNTITIAITSDTLVWAPSGGTGSRTLAANGMATAIKITSTVWMISGVGLT